MSVRSVLMEPLVSVKKKKKDSFNFLLLFLSKYSYHKYSGFYSQAGKRFKKKKQQQ